MAFITGIRRTGCQREVRPGNSKAMIASAVDHHIVARRHVTIDTLDSLWFMPVVCCRSKFRWQVTRAAELIERPARSQVRRMRIMAIRAGHTGPVHLALQKRAIDINLFVNLAVCKVKVFIEQRYGVSIRKRFAELVCCCGQAAA